MLLESAGVALRVEVSDADETHVQGEDPHTYLDRTARAKGEGVYAHHRGEDVCIVSADTIVVHHNVILGKPRDAADAHEMLSDLSGDAHVVMTGVCVIDARTGRTEQFISETAVHFTRLSEADISWYISTGEPMDKAGAYGIQSGAAGFVERIEGSYTNVVGLPLCETLRVLRSFDDADVK